MTAPSSISLGMCNFSLVPACTRYPAPGILLINTCVIVAIALNANGTLPVGVDGMAGTTFQARLYGAEVSEGVASLLGV